MAPCNGTTSAPPNLVVTLPPNHSTLQWHHAMAPSNGTTSTLSKLSTPPKLVVTLPPNHSTLQWHPTMAPSNGTTSTPLKLVVTLPPNHSTLQWQPTMAPAWCHVQSAKVVRRPPPFLKVRTPIAMAIWRIILLGLGRSSYRGNTSSPATRGETYPLGNWHSAWGVCRLRSKGNIHKKLPKPINHPQVTS